MRTEASLQSLTRNVAETWRNLLGRTNRSCLSSLPRYHPSHGAFDGRRRSILELLGNIGCPTKELQPSAYNVRARFVLPGTVFGQAKRFPVRMPAY